MAVSLAGAQLTSAGLLGVSGSHFTFVNDLVRDAVLATLARPVAVAYHRRAADLVAEHPEEMAGHAHEAGEPARAAAGYLEAGRIARRAAALHDAQALLTLALQDARDARDHVLEATVLLERAGASEACAAYEAAEDDVLVARTLLADAGVPRLELRSLGLLAGDLAIAARAADGGGDGPQPGRRAACRPARRHGRGRRVPHPRRRRPVQPAAPGDRVRAGRRGRGGGAGDRRRGGDGGIVRRAEDRAPLRRRRRRADTRARRAPPSARPARGDLAPAVGGPGVRSRARGLG